MVGFSSDQSPIQRFIAKIGCGILLIFIIFLFVVGVFGSSQKEGEGASFTDHSSDEVPNISNVNETSYEARAPGNFDPSEIASSVGIEPEIETSQTQEDAEDVPLDQVEKAMRQAFQEGHPVRWKGNGLKGYAVPSEPQAETGCRNIYYSIDSRENWQSSIHDYCP